VAGADYTGAYNRPVSRDRDAEPTDVARSLRVDLWLWYARFFRSRGLAQAAVEGGHVQVNGDRVKASRQLRVGDRLRITRDRERFEVEVTGLPARRGPATEARLHYTESEESQAARAQARALDRLVATAPSARPDKRDRRDLLRMLKGRG